MSRELGELVSAALAVARLEQGRNPLPSGAAGMPAIRPCTRSGVAHALWLEVKGRPDAAKLMRIGAWLWRTGVRDESAIRHLVGHGVKSGVHNFYAYYARGGTRRREVLAAWERRGAEEWKR